jgi:hypothetical protein
MSTIEAPVTGSRIDHQDTIEWTRRTRDLWTGRRAGAPVGTIERGARYTYVDVDGQPHGRYRSLDDAQVAATRPASRAACGTDPRPRLVHPALFVATSAALVIDGVLLGGAWLLSF